jgi:HSP20 family protein
MADFPGVATEALAVRMDASELTIEGTQAVPEGGIPFRPLHFSRTFRVPNTVDPTRVSAELSQGVLCVRLVKSEAAKPRRIEVRAS